jgi:biopolymer transport protein TolQ
MGGDLIDIYQQLSAHHDRGDCTLERTFEAGFKEFMKQKSTPVKDSAQLLGSLERAMRASMQRDLSQMESGLSFIATVGSISPYIGLLGTVWGIMNAFSGLATSGQATLSQVAPGISEALITTAIGLFAAIPAVMAYNRFNRQIDKVASQCDTFTAELSNILLRQS